MIECLAPRSMKTYRVSKYASRISDTDMKFLRNVHLDLFPAGENAYLKTKALRVRTKENIAFCNTISSGLTKPREHTDGE